MSDGPAPKALLGAISNANLLAQSLLVESNTEAGRMADRMRACERRVKDLDVEREDWIKSCAEYVGYVYSAIRAWRVSGVALHIEEVRRGATPPKWWAIVEANTGEIEVMHNNEAEAKAMADAMRRENGDLYFEVVPAVAIARVPRMGEDGEIVNRWTR